MKNYKLTPILLLLGITGCLTSTILPGCKSVTKNQSESGFRWGTEFTLFTRAAQTAPEEATSEIMSQPLLDYLAKPDAPDETGAVAVEVTKTTDPTNKAAEKKPGG